MAKRSTDSRRQKLAQIIVTEGQAKVGWLANHFNVSTETIRKDLIYLETKGIAKKNHGRAVFSSDLIERPYTQKLSEHIEEKISIAKAASEYIPDNGAVILDSGSTTYELAKLLTLRNGLTIFTNNLSAISLLAQSNNTVYLLGGKIRPSSMALIGDWALNAVHSIKADIAFLGTDGFCDREGPCSASFEEIEIKKAIIQQSKKKYLLADYSKFERSDMFLYATWYDIDGLITDSNAPAEAIKNISDKTNVNISFV